MIHHIFTVESLVLSSLCRHTAKGQLFRELLVGEVSGDSLHSASYRCVNMAALYLRENVCFPGDVGDQVGLSRLLCPHRRTDDCH